jgi:hypothetical protein
MPAKKKSKAKKKKPVKAARKKLTSAKKSETKRAPIKARSKSKATHKKKVSRTTDRSRAGARLSGIPRQPEFPGEQSGDLQGLSRIESADSESVDELVEEGNAFEADAVAGVEDADSADEREVHTHEVPEDDVPDEYLDEEDRR